MTDPRQALYHFCAKHNQRYMRFLKECPICAGEAMARRPGRDAKPAPSFSARAPDSSGQRPARHEQLRLF